MKIKELLEKGLLKEQKSDVHMVNGSVAIAARFLDRAKGNLKMDFYDVAFLLAYNAMFHSARALLFRAGYKERSHFALIEALRDVYKGDSEFMQLLDVLDGYRLTRHAIQYSGELSSKADAMQAVKDAGAFLAAVKERLVNNNSGVK